MSPRTTPSILIVEDERIVALDLQQTLGELGYDSCGIASSAAEAFQLCKQNHPTLALMDIRIKGPQDGIQTATLLRQQHHISVIYLTAHADEAMIERAKHTQPLGFLVKPVKASELHTTIEIALHRITQEGLEREHTERLVALASNSLDLNAYVDREYRYRYANDVYLDYWGIGRYEIEGQHVAHLTGAETFAKVLKPHLDRAFAGELIQYQVPFEFPRRGRRFMDIAYIPVPDPDGSIVGVVVRGHDIEEIKSVTEQLTATSEALERKNCALERLVCTLSHDLREPVNTLSNFSSLLNDEYAASLPELARQYLTHLQSGSLRLRLLLDDLLSFVRLDQSFAPHEPCDLNGIFDAVVMDLSHAISRSGARVTRKHLPTVLGQPTLLSLLIQNLISNSIKFVAEGLTPVITVDSLSRNGQHELRCIDNGIGIEESHRERIFELFGRLHSRKAYEGTGFGLAACRRIAEIHNGRIWVTATATGGCCFHVTLPACSS